MNKETAIAYIPLLQALADGELQFERSIGEWEDIENFNCAFLPERYRRKPKQEMVPLEPQDVPPGSVLRDIDFKGAVWFLVTNVGVAGVCVNNAEFSYSHLMLTKEISRDGGKTWSKCEKPRA